MYSAVTTALRSILMEEGRVCLPGIGTLVTQEQPAVLSLIEGKALPPSARISFNANLILDDGRLSRELEESSEATRFLQHTGETLASGHAVILEGIGKLYQHHDGEIRFTPGAENFSKVSFGLPTLAVQPILRKEKPPRKPSGPSRRAARRSARASRTPGLLSLNASQKRKLWYAVGLTALLVGIFLVFRIIGSVSALGGGDAGAASATQIPRERLNVPPRDAPAPPATVGAASVQPGPPPRLNAPPLAPPGDRVGTPAAVTPDIAVIAIGLFSRQRNVDKTTRRLEEAGYVPYTDREGRNTRVGVTVTYTAPAALQRALADIRDRYTEDAFVMRINGEEQPPR